MLLKQTDEMHKNLKKKFLVLKFRIGENEHQELIKRSKHAILEAQLTVHSFECTYSISFFFRISFHHG